MTRMANVFIVENIGEKMSLGTHSFDIVADTGIYKVLDWVFETPWTITLKRFLIAKDTYGRPCLVLSSNTPINDGWNSLPAELDAELTAPIVVAWLKGLTREQFPPEPDVDGSVTRGWRVCDRYHGPEEGLDWAAGVFCVVYPEWTIYHK